METLLGGLALVARSFHAVWKFFGFVGRLSSDLVAVEILTRQLHNRSAAGCMHLALGSLVLSQSMSPSSHNRSIAG
jgi:hypothetical protein